MLDSFLSSDLEARKRNLFQYPNGKFILHIRRKHENQNRFGRHIIVELSGTKGTDVCPNHGANETERGKDEV